MGCPLQTCGRGRAGYRGSLRALVVLAAYVLAGCAPTSVSSFAVPNAQPAHGDIADIAAREPVPYGAIGGAVAVHRLRPGEHWVIGYRKHVGNAPFHRTWNQVAPARGKQAAQRPCSAADDAFRGRVRIPRGVLSCWPKSYQVSSTVLPANAVTEDVTFPAGHDVLPGRCGRGTGTRTDGRRECGRCWPSAGRLL